MTSISRGEWQRKGLHIAMGLFALALRPLHSHWPIAALCALAALLFNAFVIPKFGRGIYRDGNKRHDAGIIAYPAVVLLLILLFRHNLEIAAAIWAMMAFGDPAASIAGILIGGPKLPWNREKTWVGFTAYSVIGGLSGAFLLRWVVNFTMPASAWFWTIVALSTLLAAFLESYPTGLDDNWVSALPSGLLMISLFLALLPGLWPSLGGVWLALGVNAAIALTTALLGIVGVSGAIAGGIVGTLILLFGGWGFYAVLWAFFLLGTMATKLGYRKKLGRGTAQKQQGRRGAQHVLANCGVGLLLAFIGYVSTPVGRILAGLAFTGSFAAALADTLGTEVGSLWGNRAYSLIGLRAVEPGTKGAISIPGTAGGALGALLLGIIAACVRVVAWRWVGVIAAAGIAGSLLESITLDAANRVGSSLDHEFVNALNTFIGCAVALELAMSVEWGRLFIPMPGFRAL